MTSVLEAAERRKLRRVARPARHDLLSHLGHGGGRHHRCDRVRADRCRNARDIAAAAQRPGYTAVIALTMLATAWSYATGSDNLPELMLIAGGVVLLPVRLIWAGRIDGIMHASANAL